MAHRTGGSSCWRAICALPHESAVFSQPEQGFGLIPGAGGFQHLTRLMGRARALEVMLSAEDYDAGLAEPYGSGGYFHVTSIPKKCMKTSRFGLFFGFC
jgi:1,4-dihydroxy-2-naphthoyl-CoA synthase